VAGGEWDGGGGASAGAEGKTPTAPCGKKPGPRRVGIGKLSCPKAVGVAARDPAKWVPEVSSVKGRAVIGIPGLPVNGARFQRGRPEPVTCAATLLDRTPARKPVRGQTSRESMVITKRWSVCYGSDH
jgi:hypothetical protein